MCHLGRWRDIAWARCKAGCVEQPTRVSPKQLGATVPESAQVLLTDALGFFARTLNVFALLSPV